MNKRNLQHGFRKHPLYAVFNMIQQRCNNPKNWSYKTYGGRGIKCEWQTFIEFYNDTGHFWSEGLTVERIDNNGNYSRTNCRFATRKEQANNMSRNVILEFNGQKKTLQQWAEQIGIKVGALRARITRGISVEKALSHNDLRS